jgi:fumarate hydratase class I
LGRATMSVTDMVNEGVRRAYLHPDNKLRASILRDPAGKRTNTRDNTPAVVHYDLVPGNTVEVKLAAKGGGSENKSKFTMLNPSIRSSTGSSRPCPRWAPAGVRRDARHWHRRQRGKAMVLAKGSADGADRHQELKARGPANRLELRLEIYEGQRSRHRGAGAWRAVHGARRQDSRLPTHAASLPVAIIPNCAARGMHTSRSTVRARRSWSLRISRAGPRCAGRLRRRRGA